MEILRDPNEKVICPYNNSHHIRVSRMELHLKKCKAANSGNIVLVPCDYNTCHRVPPEELNLHHSICPDKKCIELQLIKEGSEVEKVVWRPPRPFRPPPIHHQQLQRLATPVDWYHAVLEYKRPSRRRLALSYHRPPVTVPLPQRYRTSFTLT
ncbi:uncharacterized protein LOC143205679 [Rhynchophorus ferrugineus]|uniref:uncharacterized protein LOC143205679 n=1 Tax=Rhynchophorus ferrugineus TaxID=354439 RepID=UPI003FCC4FCD